MLQISEKDRRNKNKFEVGEILILQETSKGYYLHINNLKQKLRIYKGEVLNDLTEKQLHFVLNHIKNKIKK